MSDQNPYYSDNQQWQSQQQNPYNSRQYPPPQPQTVYGPYSDPSQQQAPYPPAPQPYPPMQNQGYPPPAPYPGLGYQTQSEPGSGLAIAGFILGIIGIVSSWFPFFGIVIPIVGIILSALGRRSVSRRLFATIGLVLSIIAAVISLCVIASIFIAAARNSS